MSLFIVDVEADGPAPGLYSMVCFGAIKVQRDLVNAPTFYGRTHPLYKNNGTLDMVNWIPEALAVSGISRTDHVFFPSPETEMNRFAEWILKNNEKGKVSFVSDNPAFDWQFINYYFVAAGLDNPFGHSARRIGDFYAGAMKDWGSSSKWKGLRKTKHTHNPVDDARGNAEALITMSDAFQIRLPGVDQLPKPVVTKTLN